MGSTDPEKSVTARTSSSDETLVENGQIGAGKGKEKATDDQIVGWDGDDDPSNPLNWPSAKKWLVIGSVSFSACSVTCCSSMVASTYQGMEEDFGVSRETATLALSIFIFGLGLGPLVMAPLSELYGRRPIYLIGFGFFSAFCFGVAFAQNIGTMLISRFLSGLGGSSFLSVAGGSVVDCFIGSETPVPMTIFTLSVFLGPVLGPVFATAIVYHQDWRVVWYFQLAWCGACLFLLYVFAPETFAPPMLKRKAQRLRKETGNQQLRSQSEINELPLVRAILKSCYTPFALMFTEPMALLLCSWTAVYLAIVYGFFSAFELIYSAHGFNTWQVGESFWSIGLGTILGALSTPIWTSISRRRARELGHAPPPEELLRKGVYGGIVAPIGLLWWAFTARPSIHWAVSLVPAILFGWGYFEIYAAVFNYLVAAYRPVAASAMALNSFLRSAAAGGLPLGIIQMYDALTITWASALIAFVALAFAPVPILFMRYGERLRKKSKYGTH